MRLSNDIDNEKVEKEKALQAVNDKLGEAKDIKNKLEKDILTLRMKHKDVSILYDQYDFQAKRLRSDIKILTSEFWATRNGGQ